MASPSISRNKIVPRWGNGRCDWSASYVVGALLLSKRAQVFGVNIEYDGAVELHQFDGDV